MTPKAKAIEILEKLIPHVYNEYNGSDGGRDYNAKRHTIQCALILVDEIINTHLLSEKNVFGIHPIDYWQQVKAELQQL